MAGLMAAWHGTDRDGGGEGERCVGVVCVVLIPPAPQNYLKHKICDSASTTELFETQILLSSTRQIAPLTPRIIRTIFPLMDKTADTTTVPTWLLGDSTLPVETTPDITLEQALEWSEKEKERIKAEQLRLTYEIFFENSLELIAGGRNLADLINESPHNIVPGRYRTWLHKDKKRVERLREAQAIGAEAIEDEIMRIIDATDSLEDVQRSKLKLEGRKFLLQTYSRDRYTNEKAAPSMTGGITINIGAVDSPYTDGITIDGSPLPKALPNG